MQGKTEQQHQCSLFSSPYSFYNLYHFKKLFFFIIFIKKAKPSHKIMSFQTCTFHDFVSQFLHSLVFMLELNTTHKRHSPAGHHMSFHYNYPYNPYIDCGPLSSSIISQYKSELCKCTSQISRLHGHKKLIFFMNLLQAR